MSTALLKLGGTVEHLAFPVVIAATEAMKLKCQWILFTPMIVLDDLSYHDCAFQDKGTQKTGAPVVSKVLMVCPTLRKLDLSGMNKWSVVFSRF